MARRFVAASSHLLAPATVPITAAPFSFAAWYYHEGAAGANSRTLFSLNNGTTSQEFYLHVNNTSLLLQGAATATTPAIAQTTATFVLGKWQHVAVVFASATSRTVYLNGIAGTTNTTSKTPSGINALRLGSRPTPTNYLNGLLAFPTFWGDALTGAEFLQLSQGADPRTIRPQNLVAFWPLNTPGMVTEYDQNPFAPRRYDLTVTGATPAIDPPIWTPRPKRFFIPSLSVTGNRRRRVICGSAS